MTICRTRTAMPTNAQTLLLRDRHVSADSGQTPPTLCGLRSQRTSTLARLRATRISTASFLARRHHCAIDSDLARWRHSCA